MKEQRWPDLEYRLYDLKELSRALGISLQVARRWCVGGRIEAVRVGGLWKISPDVYRGLITGEIMIKEMAREHKKEVGIG